jgi:hypothetical protein
MKKLKIVFLTFAVLITVLAFMNRKDAGILNGNLKEQYDLTSKWAKVHSPVPIAEYLLPYLLKEKRNILFQK